MRTNAFLEYITVRPGVRSGKPVIKGTRIPVDLVMGKVAGGMTTQEITAEYDLTKEQVMAVFQYAAAVVANEDVFLYESGNR
jgi:uncharacterized protein (DUF433 family)